MYLIVMAEICICSKYFKQACWPRYLDFRSEGRRFEYRPYTNGYLYSKNVKCKTVKDNIVRKQVSILETGDGLATCHVLNANYGHVHNVMFARASD